MPSPCPCRGCTAAYKAGLEDRNEFHAGDVSFGFQEALDMARDKVLDQFTDEQTDAQGARVIREHQVLDAIASVKGGQ